MDWRQQFNFRPVVSTAMLVTNCKDSILGWLTTSCQTVDSISLYDFMTWKWFLICEWENCCCCELRFIRAERSRPWKLQGVFAMLLRNSIDILKHVKSFVEGGTSTNTVKGLNVNKPLILSLYAFDWPNVQKGILCFLVLIVWPNHVTFTIL